MTAARSTAARDALVNILAMRGPSLTKIADAILAAGYSRSSGAPREWRTDPKVQEAHETLRGSMRDYAIALANDLDAVGKLAGTRKRQVNEALDALCEAVASSGAPAPTQEKQT